MTKVPRSTRARMVGWYDPTQLARTAQQVVISTIFGRHSDHRLIEAITSRHNIVFNYTRPIELKENGEPYRSEETQEFIPGSSVPLEEIWIDYVSDTGDGWDSTCAVAQAVAYPPPSLKTRSGARMSRGDILVFGGDEVYPTPSRQEYEKRLLGPWEATLDDSEKPGHVYAIPGNHDWYDSLVSFTRVFVSRGWLGGWFAPQSRSYFALKLPHRWWLLGIDVQLGSDIDGPQVEYFKCVAGEMGQGDHVILCVAEPHWISEKLYESYGEEYKQTNLAYLEKRVLERQKVMVSIAGDLHHYRRHESADGRQKITAGGGGAFLHPTHFGRIPFRDVDHLRDAELPPEAGAEAAPAPPVERIFDLKASYPSLPESRRRAWRNLLFPFFNPFFGVVTGGLYLLLCWSVRAPLGEFPLSQDHILPAAEAAWRAVVRSPSGTFWVVLTMVGFLLFTDVHSKVYRVLGGLAHGFAHLTASFFVGWFAAVTWAVAPELEDSGFWSLVGAVLTVTALGWVVGSFVLGIYLLISLNLFGIHGNEAFSSHKTKDWKNFLKMHIDRDGTLWIYPIGIRRVPRKWHFTGLKGRDVSRVAPDTSDPRCVPRMIEPEPVRVPGPGN